MGLQTQGTPGLKKAITPLLLERVYLLPARRSLQRMPPITCTHFHAVIWTIIPSSSTKLIRSLSLHSPLRPATPLYRSLRRRDIGQLSCNVVLIMPTVLQKPIPSPSWTGSTMDPWLWREAV